MTLTVSSKEYRLRWKCQFPEQIPGDGLEDILQEVKLSKALGGGSYRRVLCSAKPQCLLLTALMKEASANWHYAMTI